MRTNQLIRNVYTVNLIDHNGTNIGKLGFREALALAKLAGLDLVEVNPNSNPPTCKIMDFGKHKYKQDKQKRVTRKQAIENGTYKPHQNMTKETVLTVKMSNHDLAVKAKHIQCWLNEGCKVLVKLKFIRREIQHPQLGIEQLSNLLGMLVQESYIVDNKPMLNGKLMTMQISVNKKALQTNKTLLE